MARNHYDQASRYLAKLDPPGFLGWALGAAPRFRRWLDTRRLPFPGETDRVCDTVAELDDPDEPAARWAVPVEFMLEPEKDLFYRLLIYLGGLGLAERPSAEPGARYRVGAVVINLTGVGRTSRRMRWGQTALETAVGVVERNLAEEDAAVLLAEVAGGRVSRVLLALVPLMQGGREAGIIEEWLRLATLEPETRRRGDLGGLALVFAEASGCRSQWRQALEGWNVVQSQQVLEWMAEGEARGEARGKASGVAEGLLLGRVGALQRILRQRFGEVPVDLDTSLQNCTDVAQLDTWIDAALAADSLAAFRHAIAM